MDVSLQTQFNPLQMEGKRHVWAEILAQKVEDHLSLSRESSLGRLLNGNRRRGLCLHGLYSAHPQAWSHTHLLGAMD